MTANGPVYATTKQRHSFRSLALLAFVIHHSSFIIPAFGAARLDGDWIVVEGRGNTLETVARDVGSSKILSFDEETGYALSARSFRVTGELKIGGPDTTGSIFRYVDNLEFDVGQCGQARIVLAQQKESPPPKLSVENSRVATMRSEQGNDACQSEGNLIEVAAGRLVLRGADVTGNFVVRVGGGEVEALDSTITTSKHAGLTMARAAAARSRLVGLRLLDHQIYGMEVGPLEQPVTLERCAIRGGGADLHVRGATRVIARDCDFDSIRFAGKGGSVRRQWTVVVRTPEPGCRVVAESHSGVGVPEKVEAEADTSGVARLVLTHYVARPGGLDYPRAGKNDSTPHRLTIYAPDGKRVLGRLSDYRVFAKGQEVRIP